MAWFKKTRKPIDSDRKSRSRVPEGLWVKCPGCAQAIYNKDLAANLQRLPQVRTPLPRERHRAPAHAVRR